MANHLEIPLLVKSLTSHLVSAYVFLGVAQGSRRFGLCPTPKKLVLVPPLVSVPRPATTISWHAVNVQEFFKKWREKLEKMAFLTGVDGVL